MFLCLGTNASLTYLLRGLSPQENYTDRRLSAKLVPSSADRGYHSSINFEHQQLFLVMPSWRNIVQQKTTKVPCISKSKSHYDWRSVSQYVLVSSPIWDIWPEIPPPPSYCLVFLGRPLWREVGSVICQSLSLQSTTVSHYLQQIFTLTLCVFKERSRMKWHKTSQAWTCFQLLFEKKNRTQTGN
jgi:hypothetical protein